jgi:hypothetical protein
MYAISVLCVSLHPPLKFAMVETLFRYNGTSLSGLIQNSSHQTVYICIPLSLLGNG